jgi:4-hydroxybenzoate polyprenyltransferase
MSTIINTMCEYLRLFRLHTAAATACAPLIGGLIMGQRDISTLFVLFVIGIFYHIFGFVLNEYVDVNVDKKSIELKDKPLVSGSISKKKALYIVIISIICSYILIFIFFRSIYTLLFFSISLIFGGIYDLYGKKILGLDFVLAGGFFFLCLTGASTISIDFDFSVYLFCLLYFLHIVYNNSVEGGLKDVGHDSTAGAKTLATFMGVTVEKGILRITKSFVVFSYFLRFIFLALIVILGLQPQLLFWSDKHIFEIIIMVLLTVVYFTTLFSFLRRMKFDRARLKKIFSINEMTSFFMILIVLSPLIGLYSTVFLILLPAVWYLAFNVILYGKLLEPRV